MTDSEESKVCWRCAKDDAFVKVAIHLKVEGVETETETKLTAWFCPTCEAKVVQYVRQSMETEWRGDGN